MALHFFFEQDSLIEMAQFARYNMLQCDPFLG